MAAQMFVNLPVKDLKRSVEFFTKLGYKFDPRFTDENATCMIIGDDSFVMLLVEKFFRTFTSKEICDTTKSTELLLGVSAESRARVDELVLTAISAGGAQTRAPKEHGFMYERSFQDLDGHQWEVMYMDPSALQNMQKEQAR